MRRDGVNGNWSTGLSPLKSWKFAGFCLKTSAIPIRVSCRFRENHCLFHFRNKVNNVSPSLFNAEIKVPRCLLNAKANVEQPWHAGPPLRAGVQSKERGALTTLSSILFFPLDMFSMERVYSDKKASVHWSAARNEERVSSRR